MIVVVPMAGRGSRYTDRGYSIPKPLVEVAGKPMLFWALNSLRSITYEKIIFVALKQHEQEFSIREKLNEYLHTTFELVLIDHVTEGQLCTVLAAREFFKNDDELLIVASDSLVKSKIGEDIATRDSDIKGIISVIDLPGDRWSFAKVNEEGNVTEVAEKVRISNHASTGLYYFSRAGEFLNASDIIIKNNQKTRGEYYVIPVYQKLIEKNERVAISIAEEMWDMGTPEAKELFENYLKNYQ